VTFFQKTFCHFVTTVRLFIWVDILVLSKLVRFILMKILRRMKQVRLLEATCSQFNNEIWSKLNISLLKVVPFCGSEKIIYSHKMVKLTKSKLVYLKPLIANPNIQFEVFLMTLS